MAKLLTANRQVAIVQASFWISYFALLIFTFSARMEFEMAVSRSLILLIAQFTVVYINMEFLLPRFFGHKYAEYFFFLVLLLIGTYFLLQFLSNEYLVPEDAVKRFERFRDMGPRREGRRPPFTPGRGLAFLSFMATVALILLSTAYKAARLALQREREASELRSEKLHAELNFLKSQINPHFLFNALNNVYTLTQLKAEKAPDMLLKLSEILRYILYDCNHDRVPLGKEIAYIRNYVELQKLKDEKGSNIEIEIAGVDENLMVAPMLFIPFIENSFKHSKFEDLERGWIKIKMEQQGIELLFDISNSLPGNVHTKDEQSGIGLENVQRRLELLYPNRHELEVIHDESEFKVKLRILT